MHDGHAARRLDAIEQTLEDLEHLKNIEVAPPLWKAEQRGVGLNIGIQEQDPDTREKMTTWYTCYQHLEPSTVAVAVGDELTPGQLIGYLKSLSVQDGGAHSHFSLGDGSEFLNFVTGTVIGQTLDISTWLPWPATGTRNPDAAGPLYTPPRFTGLFDPPYPPRYVNNPPDPVPESTAAIAYIRSVFAPWLKGEGLWDTFYGSAQHKNGEYYAVDVEPLGAAGVPSNVMAGVAVYNAISPLAGNSVESLVYLVQTLSLETVGTIAIVKHTRRSCLPDIYVALTTGVISAATVVTKTLTNVNGTVLAGDGAIVVDSTASMPVMLDPLTGALVPFPITIDSEQMLVTDVAGLTLTVTRGFARTEAAGHADEATVSESDTDLGSGPAILYRADDPDDPIIQGTLEPSGEAITVFNSQFSTIPAGVYVRVHREPISGLLLIHSQGLIAYTSAAFTIPAFVAWGGVGGVAVFIESDASPIWMAPVWMVLGQTLLITDGVHAAYGYIDGQPAVGITDPRSFTFKMTRMASGAVGNTMASGAAIIISGDPNAITLINGLSQPTQTLVVGTAGTDFAIVDTVSGATAVHTFNLPDAAVNARGAVTTGNQSWHGNKTLAGNYEWAVTNGALSWFMGEFGIVGTDGTTTLSIGISAVSAISCLAAPSYTPAVDDLIATNKDSFWFSRDAGKAHFNFIAHDLGSGDGLASLRLIVKDAAGMFIGIYDGTWGTDALGTVVCGGLVKTIGSGILDVAHGGTGDTTLTAHGLLIGNGTGAITVSAAMTDGQLLVGQTGADPLPKTMSGDGTFSAAGALTVSKIGGTAFALPVTVANGGTGLATLTAHAVMLGEGTGNVAFATIGTSGRLLIDQGAGADPSFNAMSGDGTITNAGALTVSKIGGTAFALPVTVANGGTANTTFTAYAVICAGTTATGAFQNVSGLGSSGNVLTSNGAGALPTWQAAAAPGPTPTYGIATVAQIISSTTMADVTSMSFAIAAKDIWDVEFILPCQAGVDGLIFQLTGPASPTSVNIEVIGDTTGVAALSTDVLTAFSTPTTSVYATGGGNVLVRITALIRNGANAGTIRLQAANNLNTMSSPAINLGARFTAWKH